LQNQAPSATSQPGPWGPAAVPHRSSPMLADHHPHRRPQCRRHHQHRRRSSVASRPSAAGDPARHLEPCCARTPHHRPLKAGHLPADGDTRRRHRSGGRRKKKGKWGEPADPHPRLTRRPTSRPPPAPSLPASPTVTRRRQALGVAAG
jgi:hypothetical protein